MSHHAISSHAMSNHTTLESVLSGQASSPHGSPDHTHIDHITADYATSHPSDRRSDARVPFYAEVRLLGRDELYYHPASNLSLGGVFLRTEFPLAVGTAVQLELPPQPAYEGTVWEGQALKLKGRVAWCQAGCKPGTPEALAVPPILPGMGVKFVGLQDLDIARLRLLIQQKG